MADINWLRGNEFHSDIRDEANKVERISNVEFSDYGIDYLVELFEQNKKPNYLTESRKLSYQQKSKTDARESVKTLLNTAIQIAKEDGRKSFVTRADLNEAYRIHYCGVWPLCGGNR